MLTVKVEENSSNEEKAPSRTRINVGEHLPRPVGQHLQIKHRELAIMKDEDSAILIIHIHTIAQYLLD